MQKIGDMARELGTAHYLWGARGVGIFRRANFLVSRQYRSLFMGGPGGRNF